MQGDIHLVNYWAVVRRRWGLILAVAALTVAGVGAVIFQQTPLYRAQTKIRVEMEQPEIFFYPNAAGNYAPYDTQRFYRTQEQIIESALILANVIQDLRLDEAWYPGQPGAAERAFRRLQGHILVTPIEASTIITVSYDDPDPTLATRVADSVVDNYIKQRKQVRGKILEDMIESMRGQLKDNREKLDQSEAALRDFKKERGLTFIQDRPLDEDRMAELNDAFIAAKTRRVTKEAQLRQIEGLAPDDRISALVVTVDNRHFQDLRALLDKNEIDLASFEEKYGPKHPEVLEAKARIERIREQLRALANGMLNGLRGEYDQALSEETLLSGILGETRLEDQLKEESKSEYLRLKRQIEVDQEVLLTTRKRMEEATVGESIPRMVIEVVEPAAGSKVPVKPKKLLSLLAGGLLGLGGGTLLAFFLEYLHQRLASIEEVERYLKLPVLALIPRHTPLLLESAEDSPGVEAYRLLRANLHCLRAKSAISTLLFTSSTAGEGKSYTLTNLGICMARMKDRVLLVDADCRRPALHRLLNLDNRIGLPDILDGSRKLNEVARPVEGVDNLLAVASGRDTERGIRLLNSPALKAFLASGRDGRDLTLVDSPQVLGVSDTLYLAAAVDAVILVIEHNRHPRSVIVQAKKHLEEVGARIIGVVFNNVAAHEIRHYAHYYSISEESPGGEPGATGATQP